MHSVHGLVRKAPMIKQLQDSTMFIVELAEMVKDFKTGEKTYSNYKAMLFAKTEAAIAYYTKATAEGSFVVLISEKLKIETFDANSGKTYITLMMDNARLEGAHFDSDKQPSQQAPQQQQRAPTQQPAPQMAPPQQQQTPSYGTPPPNHNAPQQQQGNNQYDPNDPIPF